MMSIGAQNPAGLFLVAIVGGSGAGKTWLADRLEAALAPRVSRLSLDDFYRDLFHLSMARRARVNFDHPRAIDWPYLEQLLRDSLAGRPARMPCYDFATHTRRSGTRPWRPKTVVLCDGLWLLRRPSVRRLFRYKIFVDAPEPVRLRRRLQRDVQERGRSRASVINQFWKDVAPMHARFVAGQTRWADAVLRSPMSAAAVDQLAATLRALVMKPDAGVLEDNHE
jgi:uridine kinase